MSWAFQPLLPGAAQLQAGGGGGGPTYTLTADAGSFALTGQAAGLRAARSIAGDAGAFALAGQAAGLRAARRVVSDAAAFALSGQDIAVVAGNALIAGEGAFALSGQAAGLLAARRLTALAGGIVLSGQAATITPSGAEPPEDAAPLTVDAAGEVAVLGPNVAFRVASVTTTAPTTPLAVQRGVLRAATLAMVGGPADGRVFDHVPHGQPYPFVAMDYAEVRANDGCEVHGYIHDFYISVWSEYRGQREVWELLDRLWRALHDRTLLLENGAHVLCQVVEQRSDRDADGLTFMGRLIARIHTNPYGND